MIIRDWRLHVFRGDLVEALRQLSHQSLIPAHQQGADLLGDPSIVEQTLSGGGRERGRQRQLVQHYHDNEKYVAGERAEFHNYWFSRGPNGKV